MEVMCNNYMPGDTRLVEKLVSELKSQGIFDQFRKECISDVDTKPAYQNLRQRVEGTVATFLKQQMWSVDLNKNQLREQVRKNLHESGFLETGVERIVDQVVNPKISSVFLPKVEDVVYGFLGIEKPIRNIKKEEKKVSITDLLPTDLEAISPESVESFKTEKKDDSLNDSLPSSGKVDDDESPPFEPLCVQKIENSAPAGENKLVSDETSRDSHLSGFSGLQSHESSHGSDAKVYQMEISNQDSLNSSETHLSIVTSEETTKMEICENSNFETKMDMQLDTEDKADEIHKIDEVDSKITIENVNKSEELENHIKEKNDEKKKDKKADKFEDKKSKSSDKSSNKDRKDDKYKKSNSSSSKEKDKSSSKYSSHKDHTSSKDKNEQKKDSKNSSYKDKDRSRERSDKDKSDKDKDKSSKYKDKEKYKSEKDKSDKEKKVEKSKYEKESANKTEKEKSDKNKDRTKIEKDKNKSEKDKSNRDKDKYKNDKDKDKNSKEKSKDKIDKDKNKEKSDRDKERNLKEKSFKEKDNVSKEIKNKEANKETSKDKSRNSGSSSKHSSEKNKKKDSNSSHSKKDFISKSSDKIKKDEHQHSNSSNNKKDKPRESKNKSKDDHYSSKIKKTDRRSTDRDSNDGRSSRQNYLGSFTESTSSRSENNSQDYSNSSFSGGSGDSGNSEELEKLFNEDSTEQNLSESKETNTFPTNVQMVKYIKPKFASNFEEARKIMKIRKQLAKLERQNQLSLAQIELPLENGFAGDDQSSDENGSRLICNGDDDNMDLSEEKENINISQPFEEHRETVVNRTLDNQININNINNENTKPNISHNSNELYFERTDLSKEKFEALEAKLAQVMANVNSNSYESDDDYEFRGYSSAEILSKNDIKLNLDVVKKTILNHQMEQDLTFKNNINPSGFTGETVADVHTYKNKKINNAIKFSVVLHKEGDEVHCEDDCLFLDKPTLNEEKNLEYIHRVIEQLQREVKEILANSQNNFWPVKRGRKRKLEENVDIKNNNTDYFGTVKKRRESASSNSIISKANKKRMCNNSDIMSNQHFSLPLSPAESDKSNERKEEDLLIPIKQKRIIREYTQRYSSDDLYKPRPAIGRRNKFPKSTG